MTRVQCSVLNLFLSYTCILGFMLLTQISCLCRAFTPWSTVMTVVTVTAWDFLRSSNHVVVHKPNHFKGNNVIITYINTCNNQHKLTEGIHIQRILNARVTSDLENEWKITIPSFRFYPLVNEMVCFPILGWVIDTVHRQEPASWQTHGIKSDKHQFFQSLWKINLAQHLAV